MIIYVIIKKGPIDNIEGGRSITITARDTNSAITQLRQVHTTLKHLQMAKYQLNIDAFYECDELLQELTYDPLRHANSYVMVTTRYPEEVRAYALARSFPLATGFICPEVTTRSDLWSQLNYETVTRDSLRGWRSLKGCSGYLDRIEAGSKFGDWETIEEDNKECNLMMGKNRFFVGIISSAMGRGSCFGDAKGMTTSRHVTKGNSVVIKCGTIRREWKVSRENKFGDTVEYGDPSGYTGEPMKQGEIVALVQPLLGVARFYIVAGYSTRSPIGGPEVFSVLNPIKLNTNITAFTRLESQRLEGCSGCPIIDYKGKVRGVYGLNDFTKHVEGDSNKFDACNKTTITQMSAFCAPLSQKISPDEYFTRCAEEFVNNDDRDMALSAPTGVGKTVKFPVKLAAKLNFETKILILENNTIATQNAFCGIQHELMSKGVQDRVYLTSEIGQRNATGVKTQAAGKETAKCKIRIVNYGKFLTNISFYCKNNDIIILDKVHDIENADVANGIMAVFEQINTPSTMRRTIQLTATPIAGLSVKMLGEGMQIMTTRFPINRDVELFPSGEGESTSNRFLVFKSGDIGTSFTKVHGDSWRFGAKVCLDDIPPEGRWLVFCHSRRACEKLCHSYNKKKIGDKTGIFVHGGVPYDVASFPKSCIIFCTNILAQSVTIDDVSVVMDLMIEMKPKVELRNLGEEIQYTRVLEPHRISLAKSTQIAGRAGRVRSGFYVKLHNVESVGDCTFENCSDVGDGLGNEMQEPTYV